MLIDALVSVSQVDLALVVVAQEHVVLARSALDLHKVGVNLDDGPLLASVGLRCQANITVAVRQVEMRLAAMTLNEPLGVTLAVLSNAPDFTAATN